MRASTSVLATVFTVRASAVNLADIPRCVTCVLFWVQTFDCVYFQRSCNVTNLERVNLLQEQVAATLLDPRNMPDLSIYTAEQKVPDSNLTWDQNHVKMALVLGDIFGGKKIHEKIVMQKCVHVVARKGPYLRFMLGCLLKQDTCIVSSLSVTAPT